MEGEGVFCHQCRQRTMRRVFTCNNVRRNRPCKIKICDRCLKNRYPDITEEAASSDDWKCPKCCENCNCSVCVKKEGKTPLGRVLRDLEKPSEEGPAEVSEPYGEEENQREDISKGKRKAKAPRQPRRVKAKEEVVEPELPLPLGVPLTTVAGIELHPQDVGHALQFVEFCVAFEKVLKFGTGKGKAKAESLLGDLMNQKYPSVSRFQAKLLSLISLMPLNQNSWFEDLSSHFSQDQLLLKELPSDFFGSGVEGYDSFDFSQKLRVLTFLCDEALGSESVRKFLDRQKEIFPEGEKEVKKKVSAAKAKVIILKQQLKSEVAKGKAIAAGDDTASTSDHEATVSRLKSEVAQAEEELLEAEAWKSKWAIQHDSVRTEPNLCDADGRAFWKLTGYDDGDTALLQDMGTWDPFTSSDEKWFLYGAEKKEAVEKYCSSVRTRNLKAKLSQKLLPSNSGSKEDEKLENATTGSEEDDITKSSAEDEKLENATAGSKEEDIPKSIAEE